MLTIQEVGTDILGNKPKKFYIFAGSEQGIKEKYISILEEHYGAKKESPSVSQILDMMSMKHFVPLKPTLYVIRYDEEFLASLSDGTKRKIESTDIVGTIVCLYDSTSKGLNKASKYLGDYTVSIDAVSESFVIKYLHSDFSNLPDRLISLAARIGANYGDSRNICKSMSTVRPEELFALTDAQLTALFGKITSVSDAEFKKGIASRNFSYLNNLLETYTGELDSILYTILSTMIELERLLSNSYTQSDIREYVKRWTKKDVYNMFMNTYDVIRKLRSYATDVKSSLIYLFGLLQFSEIPDIGEMI